LVGLDIFMILTGLLAGSRSSGFGRGFWFIVSTVAMIALLYLVVTRLFSEAASQPEAVHQIFRTLALLTVVLWSFYPIVWLIGTEGFGAVNSTVEVLLFLVLDFLAKIGFGFLLLTNRTALGQAGGRGVQTMIRRVLASRLRNYRILRLLLEHRRLDTLRPDAIIRYYGERRGENPVQAT
jgi:bacteriorhodopsin